jgi:hypothetical protein
MKYLLFILILTANYSFAQEDTLAILKNEMTVVQSPIKMLQEKMDSMENEFKTTITDLEIGLVKKTLEDIISKDSTIKDIKKRLNENNKLLTENEKDIETEQIKNKDLEKQFKIRRDSVNTIEDLLSNQIAIISDSLNINISHVAANDSIIKTEQAKAEKNFLYTIVGILVVLVLVILIYLLTQRRAKSIEQKTDDLDASTEELKAQLSQLSTSTSEDLASALDKFASISSAQPTTDSEPDHSMVIEFAKQIVTMENNISRMDPEARGLNRIKRAIEKMHNTLKTMDYEIVPLLGEEIIIGKIIDIGIREPDESIELGKQIVYNVDRAEIQFKGEQIQKAKVDIKYNPND